MPPSLHSFASELNKLGSVPRSLILGQDSGDETADAIVESSIGQGKSYARNIVAGAIIAPVMSLLSRSLGRFIHNRGVMKAVGEAISAAPKRALMGELKMGPLIGRSFGHAANMAPVVSYGDLASDAFSGAAGGSIVKALKDRAGRSKHRERLGG